MVYTFHTDNRRIGSRQGPVARMRHGRERSCPVSRIAFVPISVGTEEEQPMVSRQMPVAKNRKGFTLVELAVVIVIIGVLAAFGVPRFINSVERSKAAEAFAYLSAVRAAQERYHAQNGTYADTIAKLDIKVSPPKYFDDPSAAT